MNALQTSLVVAALLLAAVSGVPAQVPAPSLGAPSLATARTLYASAEYGGALGMLNGLLSQNPPATDRQSIGSLARSASWPSAIRPRRRGSSKA